MSRKSLTLTDVVREAENTLGLSYPDDGKPEWKHRMIAVSRMKKAIAKQPRQHLYTPENLMVVVERCRQRKQAITSPVYFVLALEQALSEVAVAEDESASLDRRIDSTIAREMGRGDPDGWVSRFARARGSGRVDVLREYEKANG